MTVINCDQVINAKAIPIDRALEEAKFGKFNYCIIIISGLVIINTVLESVGISYVLPIAECDLNLSQKEKSLLSGVSFFGIIASSHLWGFLADTKGRRKVIYPSLMAAFITTVVSSFSVNFLMLVLLRFLNGVFISGPSSTIFPYLGEFHLSSKRNRAIMAASFIAAFTSIIFPVLAFAVINQNWQLYLPFLNITYKPWRLFMIVCGLPGFISGCCLLKWVESPKFLLSIGDETKTLDVLRKMYTMNTGKPKEEYLVVGVLQEESSLNRNIKLKQESSKSLTSITKLMWHQTAPLFSKFFIRGTFLLCFLQFCTYISAHGMRMWFPQILNSVSKFTEENTTTNSFTICDIVQKERRIMDLNTNSTAETFCVEKLEMGTYVYSMIFEAVYAVFFIVVASSMKIIGRVKVLFVILIVCGICGIASVLVPVPTIGLFLYLVQLLSGLGVTVINAISVDLFPTHHRAMAVCISLMAGRIGSIVGSNVSGLLLTNYCNFAFYGSGSALILSGLLVFLLPKPEKSDVNQLDEIDEDDDELIMTRL